MAAPGEDAGETFPVRVPRVVCGVDPLSAEAWEGVGRGSDDGACGGCAAVAAAPCVWLGPMDAAAPLLLPGWVAAWALLLVVAAAWGGEVEWGWLWSWARVAFRRAESVAP